MKVVKGNLWDFVGKGYIVIPTNGDIKKDGDAVMGAGLAKQAADRYPELPTLLGQKLKLGNRLYHFMEQQITTFPTKHSWKEPSDMNLIMESAMQLARDTATMRYQQRLSNFYLPQVGCGLGGLKWEDVFKKIAPILDDAMIHFVIPDLEV